MTYGLNMVVCAGVEPGPGGSGASGPADGPGATGPGGSGVGVGALSTICGLGSGYDVGPGVTRVAIPEVAGPVVGRGGGGGASRAASRAMWTTAKISTATATAAATPATLTHRLVELSAGTIAMLEPPGEFAVGRDVGHAPIVMWLASSVVM